MDPCSKQNCDEEFQNTMEVGTSASFVMSWKVGYFLTNIQLFLLF